MSRLCPGVPVRFAAGFAAGFAARVTVAHTLQRADHHAVAPSVFCHRQTVFGSS